MKPFLSVGIIFKNEIRCLERCFKALEPLRNAMPCEIVVADTGATDGSREVAEKYADKVIDFPWINDFSAARNAVMDECTGDWYFSLDADEVLDNDISGLIYFLKNANNSRYDGGYITINNYDTADDLTSYQAFQAFRLIRMSTQARFEGKIHESWNGVDRERCSFVIGTVLWHDGYLECGVQSAEDKCRRNLPLIVKALEKKPKDLLKLMQALDASAHRENLEIYYSRKIMALLEENDEIKSVLEPSACQKIIATAFRKNIPEIKEWIQFAFNKYGSSIFTQVDVVYLAIELAQQKNNWEDVLRYCELYNNAYQKAEIDKDPEVIQQLTTGALLYSNEYNKEYVQLAMAEAYYKQAKWSKCGELLKEKTVKSVSTHNVEKWIELLLATWEKLDWRSKFAEIGAFICEEQKDKADATKQRKIDKWLHLSLSKAGYEAQEEVRIEKYPKKFAYQLLQKMGNTDIAYLAEIFICKNREDAQKAVNAIQDWSVPIYGLISRMKELDVQLPPLFYDQETDTIIQWTEQYLDEYRYNIKEALAWGLQKRDDAFTALWNYQLVLAASHHVRWAKEDPEILDWIVERFEEQCDCFLKKYYGEAVLNDRGYKLMPMQHRFGWLYLQACEKRKNNQQVEYVKALHRCVKEVPAMKNMIRYLSDKAQKEQENFDNNEKELEELAMKVRMILQSFPENDPQIIALKQSAVYKKIKHIIER